MPGKDKTHELVRALVEKAGWRITHDPYSLKFGERDLTIDLGAQGTFAAEMEGRKIAVEVKSFVGRSEMAELEKAIGQVIIYRRLLRKKRAGANAVSGDSRRCFRAAFKQRGGGGNL